METSAKIDRMIAEFKRINLATAGNNFTYDQQYTMDMVVKALKSVGAKHEDFVKWAKESGNPWAY